MGPLPCLLVTGLPTGIFQVRSEIVKKHIPTKAAHLAAADAMIREVSRGEYRIVRDPLRLRARQRQTLQAGPPGVTPAWLWASRLDEGVCPQCLKPSESPETLRFRVVAFRCEGCGWKEERAVTQRLRVGLLRSVGRFVHQATQLQPLPSHSPFWRFASRRSLLHLQKLNRYVWTAWGMVWLVFLALLLLF